MSNDKNNVVKFSSREERAIKATLTNLNEQVVILQMVDRLVRATLNGLEQNHPDAFGQRPCWPELAMSNALEYMDEAAGAWEDMMLKLNMVVCYKGGIPG